MTGACRRSPESTAPPAEAGRAALQNVTLPEMTRGDAPVREQAASMHAALQKMLADPKASDADLGLAFGDFGVLLHAAEYYDAAEPAYLNAQALVPTEPRWPYFLGHLYKSRGDTAKSMAAFERALERAPTDIATLVWLGRGYQELGQPDRAAPMFERALKVAPDTVAALAGLGQIALGRNDYTRAVQVLEQALAINPGAASLHSPLAQAYRGLGQTARAEAHLQQWRNTDILVDDPMRQQLDIALQSGLAYELRGVRALEARDFATAMEMFRAGVALAPGATPLGRSLRHKLGTALALSGDIDGAVEQFREVVRLAPAGERD
jgi:tetratricopeptide (TPR) repeat protein